MMLITDPKKLHKYSEPYRIWHGIPTVEKTEKGRVYVALFSGGVTEEIGNYVYVMKADDGVSFGDPVAVCYEEGQRCFDPNLWIDPLGRLWLCWARMPDYGVFAAVCDDPDAESPIFGEPFCVTDEAAVMINKPTVLSTGEWLFPAALWRRDYFRWFNFRVEIPADATIGAFVYKSVDNGKTFTRLGVTEVANRSFDEHMVLELTDGTLAMYVRTEYGIAVCYSYDRGRNWTAGVDSGLKGPCSRFHIRRLRSGRVLLLNHYDFKGRNNLYALLSEDDGKTFPYRLLLDGRNDVSYPDCREGEDGYIDIVYDRERGAALHSFEEVYARAREILHSRITEEDILKGELVSEGSFLGHIISKLGRYAREDEDVFGEYYERYSDARVASILMSSLPKEKIIPRVFELYRIPCTEANGVDIAAFDALVKRFETAEDSDHALLSSILSVLRRGHKEETSDGHPVVGLVKDFIRETYTEDVAIDEIAERFGISRYYMAHLFKAETGTTISAFRKECKLSAAKRMLLTGEEPIAEIAGACGYYDANYFSRIFKESEGITPSEYRRLHRK